MNIFEAIARSAGNKAVNTNDNGSTVIVQQRYKDVHEWWFHAWRLGKSVADDPIPEESDISRDFQYALEYMLSVSKKDEWRPI